MNEQEKFWMDTFGTEYIGRNKIENLLPANINLFAKILSQCSQISSVLELGCNIGANLKALELLSPQIKLNGVEINKNAVSLARGEFPGSNIVEQSIIEPLNCPSDLVFTKTVLIHISPEKLVNVYKNLYENALKYILVAEYYNPNPIDVLYRGHKDKLFKRDFCGELLDRYPSLELVDYGFNYHRDPVFPQDDINWFLMKKNN